MLLGKFIDGINGQHLEVLKEIEVILNVSDMAVVDLAKYTLKMFRAAQYTGLNLSL